MSEWYPKDMAARVVLAEREREEARGRLVRQVRAAQREQVQDRDLASQGRIVFPVWRRVARVLRIRRAMGSSTRTT